VNWETAEGWFCKDFMENGIFVRLEVLMEVNRKDTKGIMLFRFLDEAISIFQVQA
jgi:hypothetical protein